MKVKIGDTVLFKLENGKQRPMIVTEVIDRDTVNGLVFYDGWNDNNDAGVHFGTQRWARGVTYGNNPGNWRGTGG